MVPRRASATPPEPVRPPIPVIDPLENDRESILTMNARRGSQPAESPTRSSGKSRARRAQTDAAQNATSFGQRPWRNAALACGVVWLGLIAWRWEIIDEPPYWDSAMGLFVEADFLAETGFNYGRLVNEERRFIEGGTGIYLVSVMPTLLALLMRAAPSTQAVLLVGHLANLALAAALLVLVYDTLTPRAGRSGAALAAGALLSTPLFAAQVDMIGMDLPMTLVAFVAGRLLVAERYYSAAVVALLAYFIKLSGLLWMIAAFGCCGLLLISALLRGDRAGQARHLIGIGALFLALAVEMAVMDWVNSLHTTVDQERFVYNVEAGLSSLSEVRYWCPDLLLLTALALVGGIVSFVGRLRARGGPMAGRTDPALSPRRGPSALPSQTPAHHTTAPRNAILMRATHGLEALLADRQTLFGWLILLATVAALAQIYTIPRYLLLPLVFLWVNLGLVLFANPTWRRWGWGAAVLVIGLNLANSRGQFFPAIASIDEFDQRTGALLERSREYLKDHRANLAAVKYLVDNAGSRPIVAPNPYVHFLSLPRLGYIERPLAGYAANSFQTPTFPPLEKFRGRVDAGNPLIVWVANRFAPIVNCRLLRPDPAAGDELLHYSKLDPAAETTPSLAIYEHRVAPPGGGTARPTSAEQHAALVAWLFPADDVMTRLTQLIDDQQFATAVELCRQALATEPMRGDLRLRYGLLLAKVDQTPAAIAELNRLLDDAPANIPARRALAEILIADNRTPEGLQQLNEVVRREPKLVEVWRQLGGLHAAAGRYQPARLAFERAVELNPREATAWLLLARTWRAEGDNAAARHVLNEATATLPASPELWSELGVCSQAMRDYRAALDAFRRAHQLQPESREIANTLAWHLATVPDAALRDPAAAVGLAEIACADRATTPPGWLDTLAATYAANNQFDDAVRTGEAALAAARAAKDEKLATAVTARLDLYRQSKAYVVE